MYIIFVLFYYIFYAYSLNACQYGAIHKAKVNIKIGINPYCFSNEYTISILSHLFTALLWHGYTSKCLHDSIIQPIPKDFKNPAMSVNYHRIALASCFSKLLKLCILMLSPVCSTLPICSLDSRGASLLIFVRKFKRRRTVCMPNNVFCLNLNIFRVRKIAGQGVI